MEDNVKGFLINGKRVAVEVVFSLNSMIQYIEFLQSQTPRSAFARTLSAMFLEAQEEGRIDFGLDENDFLQATDEELVPFIYAIVDDDKDLRNDFDSKAGIDEFERFAVFVNDFYAQLSEPWDELGKYIGAIQESPGFQQLSNAFALMRDDISKCIETVTQIAKSYQTAIFDIASKLAQFASDVSKAPGDTSKAKAYDARMQWAKYGWSSLPDAPIHFLNNIPDSKKAADKSAQSYCTSQNLNSLFKALGEFACKDIKEAVSCFRNREYKACALLLFGMIDESVIKPQPIDKNGKNRRKVGYGAIKILETRITELNKVALYPSVDNLLGCLCNFYSDGKDFKNEPDILNRNFAAHGMNRRPVRKRDCIQLFYLLYNLLVTLKRMG